MIDFENGHRFEVMTSTALIGKAPKGFNWAAYYATFEPGALMTPRELAVHIWRGYCVYAGMGNGQARGEFCQRWAYRLRLRRRRHNQRS
jgi:hypothetical protein